VSIRAVFADWSARTLRFEPHAVGEARAMPRRVVVMRARLKRILKIRTLE
jgi:hypothetical protein